MQKLPINPFLDFYATPDAMIINPFVFGGGAFDPLSLSPALWLSDTGADASTWPDLSGNGRDATQATAGQRPAIITNELNGRQVRRFDGGDILAHPLAINGGNSTVFVVGKRTGASSDFNYFFQASAASQPVTTFIFSRFNAVNKWGAFNSSAFIDSGLDTSAWTLMQSDYDGTTTRLRTNGGSLVSDTNGIFAGDLGDRRFIGGYNGSADFLIGDIAEILVFPTALNTTDRQNVENYLNAKYNIY